MRSIEHPFDTSPEAAVTALLNFPLADPELDPELDTAIFSPLPITEVEPFARPRLRLLPADFGRRGAAVAQESLARPQLRLTRRGRVVVVVAGLLVAALMSALLFVIASGPGAGHVAVPVPDAGSATVTVAPGDTLWAIAQRVAPNADPRSTVQQIIDRNRLVGTSIEAGQVLSLSS